MMRSAGILAGLVTILLLPAGAFGAGVPRLDLEKYDPGSFLTVGERMFFTSRVQPGVPTVPNVYELKEGTSTPRALLTSHQAKQFRPSNRVISRPGKSSNILLLSGQLEESATGEMWTCFVLVDADSSEVKPLARNGRDNREPSFSRDGRMLAFWSGSGKIPFTVADQIKEGYALHVLDVETGQEREVAKAAPLPAPNSPPVWSPDGKGIAFVCALDSSLRRRIHLVNEDGTGLTTPKPDAKIEPESIVWPDPERLLFTQFGAPGLYELNLQSLTVRLAKEGMYQPPLELAPDGNSLKTRFAEAFGKPIAPRVLRLPGLEHAPELETKVHIRE